MTQYDMPYKMVKARGANTAVFVKIEDCDALDALRAQYGNQDFAISVAFYESADPSSRCTYALCLHIRSGSLEQVRQSALEVVYYLAENCGIPLECIDLTYNGGGIVAQDDGRANTGTATPAEIVILVPPVVFDGRPTTLAAALNYDLACQMRKDGIENLDLDVYGRDHFAPLKDCICEATGRFIVRVDIRELLYFSPGSIHDAALRQRGDDCLSAGRLVPEAAEWFAEALAEKEKQARHQSQLREHLLRLGWMVCPCIRKLDWADLSKDDALEACRIIAGFYPFIGAGEDEVRYHIHRVSDRHGLQQGAQLRAIVTFGKENPAFECNHPLLRQFCSAGGCFMKELMHECQNPLLFT